MKLIIFDCDSTLSSIEGIDELARAKGPHIFSEVETLTNAAMNGEVPLDQVFARRLDIIRPDSAACKRVEKLYIDTIEPTAISTLKKLRSKGWYCIILSGGFKRLIKPLADRLEIERIEAVPLHLDENGSYISFDNQYPTTYNGGKTEIIRHLKVELSPDKIIMVGDGISDLETQPEVDSFIGYGGFTSRQIVKDAADHFIYSLEELIDLV